MAVFINPKIDFAFKIIFGSEDSTDRLISFLNAILYEGRPVIKAVTILNPYLPGDVESLKDTFVDIQARLSNGSIIIIEMQTSIKPDFFKRIIYNVAKKYTHQLESGEYYSQLHPVIGLVVADFVYASATNRPVTKFALLETTDHFMYPEHQDFQVAVVELVKFRKHLEQIDNEADMWLFFLNYADELEEVPKQMTQVKEIQSAFEAAKRINLTALELEEIEKRRFYAMSEQENLAWARRDARAQGLEIGIRQSLGVILESKFGRPTSEVNAKLATLITVEQLQQAMAKAALSPSLDDFLLWLEDLS